MNAYDIGNKIEKLPDHVIGEINDFVDFLLNKYGSKKIESDKFNFDWEGQLSHLKSKYSSVELQHKAMEWR
ncbi:MAG: DUF2281 domain-containing protein [candidate division KSB1 bacterium]|nr:DUF2281 domain-containing protein [candidate division KSB1 bacterium]